MKWTDTREIAHRARRSASGRRSAHAAASPTCKRWVLELPGFDDDPKHSGEKILEAIQMAWIDEGDFDDVTRPARASDGQRKG